jgi:hypothetical protein
MTMAFPSRRRQNAIKTPDGNAASVPARAETAPVRADEAKSSRGTLETAVRRIIEVVDEETEALRRGGNADLKSFNERKSLGLIELNRALRLLEGAEPDPTARRLLESLNEKLTVNRHVLTIHLEAIREVAGVISQSIRDAESDGTYTFAFRSKGRTP